MKEGEYMEVSIFQVLGPVMVGPSSSHTAGAVRLAQIAALIAQKPFHHVTFYLHGSFAKTYQGHGTDMALVAGILGMGVDDERIPEAFELAEEAGIDWDFTEISLENVHENSVKIQFDFDDGSSMDIVGSSVGGGDIVICEIDGYRTSFTARSPMIIIRQKDKKGVISNISGILAENGINIAVMSLSRKGKGETALCLIEIDSAVASAVLEEIRKQENVISVCGFQPM